MSAIGMTFLHVFEENIEKNELPPEFPDCLQVYGLQFG